MIGETAAPPVLRPREDDDLPERLARSAAALEGVTPSAEEALAWLDRRREEIPFAVERIRFEELDGWSFDRPAGNLVHRSGRFFTVEGLRVAVGDAPSAEWFQPIICQPEIGILGVLAKEFDGVLHFLMQAKMEPGNPNLLQLSPTVQATRSNYTKVHRGAAVRYLDHFIRPGRVLSDVRQSEHGSWFYRKRNRNMVVETAGEVTPHEDFRWLTLGQIGALLHRDNVVNMDARSVLAGLPGDTSPRALRSDADLMSWISAERSMIPVRSDRVPLGGLPGWSRGPWSIDHERERYFRVVAVSVTAGNREVAHWTQPILQPRGTGVVAFLIRDVAGVPHVLARARVEGGFVDTAELGPTVQCVPGNHAHLPEAERPPFLDLVTDPDPARVRYAASHSEEGGRFLDAVSRYLVVEADESQAPLDPPPGFQWVSLGQLSALARHSHYVNVQARTLIACLNATRR